MPNPVTDKYLLRKIAPDSTILQWEGDNAMLFVEALIDNFDVKIRQHPLLPENLYITDRTGMDLQIRPGDCIAIHLSAFDGDPDSLAVLRTGEGLIIGKAS